MVFPPIVISPLTRNHYHHTNSDDVFASPSNGLGVFTWGRPGRRGQSAGPDTETRRRWSSPLSFRELIWPFPGQSFPRMSPVRLEHAGSSSSRHTHTHTHTVWRHNRPIDLTLPFFEACEWMTVWMNMRMRTLHVRRRKQTGRPRWTGGNSWKTMDDLGKYETLSAHVHDYCALDDLISVRHRVNRISPKLPWRINLH